MELDSNKKYKIINDLINKTVDNKIHWVLYSTISNINIIYKYAIKLTESKYLVINLCESKNISDSYLSFYFRLKNYEYYVNCIKLIEYPLLYKLISEVRKRTNFN
jgi:hypothetical protein